MPHPADMLPPSAVLSEMGPRELAPFVLRLVESNDRMTLGAIHTQLFHEQPHQGFERQHQRIVWERLAAVWGFLEGQGLLIFADDANGQNGWRCVSPEARDLIRDNRLEEMIAGTQLPTAVFHPRISAVSELDFMRGEWDVAVFRAYRELEVVVRELGGFGAEDIGARLMRSAFKAGTGPLADRGIPEGEQESIAHLFAGAVGRFKNPHSHRHHIIADANAAYRILVICSQLMYEAEAGANDGDR